MTILKWALIFFLVSIVAGVLGFTGISAASADVARFLFYVFVVIFLVLLILGLTIFRVKQNSVIPGRCDASNPESRDSGFVLRTARNDGYPPPNDGYATSSIFTLSG